MLPTVIYICINWEFVAELICLYYGSPFNIVIELLQEMDYNIG